METFLKVILWKTGTLGNEGWAPVATGDFLPAFLKQKAKKDSSVQNNSNENFLLLSFTLNANFKYLPWYCSSILLVLFCQHKEITTPPKKEQNRETSKECNCLFRVSSLHKCNSSSGNFAYAELHPLQQEEWTDSKQYKISLNNCDVLLLLKHCTIIILEKLQSDDMVLLNYDHLYIQRQTQWNFSVKTTKMHVAVQTSKITLFHEHFSYWLNWKFKNQKNPNQQTKLFYKKIDSRTNEIKKLLQLIFHIEEETKVSLWCHEKIIHLKAAANY